VRPVLRYDPLEAEADGQVQNEGRVAQAAPLPTANWRHVEHGKITSIRVTFDPRPLTN